MLTLIMGLLLLVFVFVPILYLFYVLQSKYYPCPFCGNSILKSDKICPFCSENLKELDTLDKKLVKIGKSYREGAELRAKGDDEIEKRYKERKR
jgi:hypothetical protein